MTEDLSPLALERITAAGMTFDPTAMALLCTVAGTQQHPTAVVVTIATEIRVAVAPPITFYDTSVGIGATRDEALIKALDTWVQGVYVTVTFALKRGGAGPVRVSEITLPDYWTKLPQVWELFSGPFQVAGADRDHLARHLENQQPFLALRQKDLLPPTPVEIKFFSAKLFLARLEDGTMESECSIDANPWKPGAEALKQFAWPTQPGFLMFRQYLVGRYKHPAPAPPKKFWQFWK